MADWMKSWRLLILFGLLSLTDPFEVRGEEWEELSPDIAALHHLRGLSEHIFDGNIRNPPNHKPLVMEMLSPLHRDIDQNAMSLLSDLQENEKFTASVIQEEQDFEGFLAEINDQKTQDVLLSASEISHSYSQKLLFMTDKEQSTNDRVQQEYSMDPRYSVIVSNECLSNASCVPEADSYTLVKRPQRPVDHSTRYDHQQILILEDNPAVRTAATYLFEKHPAVSSVYVLDNNQRPVLIRGDSVPLTEDSRLVLVGHGRKDNSGETRLGGYEVQEVSKIIQLTSRDSNKIKTISVVACDVGSDEAFIETLLKDLHETAGIETKLHIRNAVIQVRHTGEKITQEISKDGEQWRHKDYSKKVVATLDRNGDVIIRSEPGSKGKDIFTAERNFLGKPGAKAKKTAAKQNNPSPNEKKNDKYEWPTDSKRFINQNVYYKLSVAERNACDELEALSWGFFHNERIPAPQKMNTANLVPGDYYLTKIEETVKEITDDEKRSMLSKCYEINSGENIRNVIRHYAKTGENEVTYLKVNDWILEVKPNDLYVSPVGKRINNEDEKEKEKERKEVERFIKDQKGGGTEEKQTYYHMRGGCNERSQYARYVEGIFRNALTTTHITKFKSTSIEGWCTMYFTASVISESTRNFRTFPLILMALELAGRTDNEDIKEKGLKFLLEENTHSMAAGGSWIDETMRGFSGSADYEGSSQSNDEQKPSTSNRPKLVTTASNDGQKEKSSKLTEVIKKETKLYQLWTQNTENNPAQIIIFAINNYMITDHNSVPDYEKFKTDVAGKSNPQASINNIPEASIP